MPDKSLHLLQQQFCHHAHQLLQWWMQHTVDNTNGGLVGRISNNGVVDKNATKGSVLNSRILYTFAAAYNRYQQPQYLQMAHRAFSFIDACFVDNNNGGVYWTVDHTGQPLDTKKQLYAQAFALYGVTEYCLAANNPRALQLANQLYNTIEKNGHYNQSDGYGEAYTCTWQLLTDQRLSVKDENEQRSANTHLHMLEAYANLYRLLPSEGLRHHIQTLIKLFLQHIIHPKTGHLIMFFNEGWEPRSTLVSYGHDIEAAWLLHEAAVTINDYELVQQLVTASVVLANAAARGLDVDGGLWYEKDEATGTTVHQKHWWPQAEAMVGFLHAWQVTGQQHYYHKSLAAWHFIQQKIIDPQHGEWYWGVDANGLLMANEDKVGLWKCPYHNVRACMQMEQRLQKHAAL